LREIAAAGRIDAAEPEMVLHLEAHLAIPHSADQLDLLGDLEFVLQIDPVLVDPFLAKVCSAPGEPNTFA
jgi:hypothetical protein